MTDNAPTWPPPPAKRKPSRAQLAAQINPAPWSAPLGGIHEYVCDGCGETFVGDGLLQEEHGACGGYGTLVGSYGGAR